MTRRTFRVRVSREAAWWLAVVDGGAGGWETRRLEQLEDEVRHALAALHGLDAGAVSIEWEYDLPRDVQATLRGYLAAGERRRQVEAEYVRTQRATAWTLADSLDLPVRDVARLMGMSRSHAATLLRPTSARRTRARRRRAGAAGLPGLTDRRVAARPTGRGRRPGRHARRPDR